MLLTLIPLGQERYDLSEEIDRQVAEAGGEAVLSLTVTAHYSAWTFFATLLAGILPVQSHVEVTGVIVARDLEAEPVPAPDLAPSDLQLQPAEETLRPPNSPE
jgi:hypothetical protein